MSYSYEDYVAYYKYYYGEQYGTYYAQQAAAAAGLQVGVAAAAPPPPNSQARFFGTFQITFGSGHSQFLDQQYVKTSVFLLTQKQVMPQLFWRCHGTSTSGYLTHLSVLVFSEELTRLRPEV